MSFPPREKMTEKQAESLHALDLCLRCGLCNKRMADPATLISCAHSFCRGCILRYTENSWICPLPGCGAPVTMKGGSTGYVNKNHVITDVVSSLGKVEQIMASGPDNWWVGEGNKDQRGMGAEQTEDEEEVIDFQAMMGESGKRKREESSDDDDDASSITKELDMGKENAANGQCGRKTMSIDQSLFSSDGRGKFNTKAAPPEFSCSPIAMQSSQPEPNSLARSTGDDDERQTATASQLDRVLMPSAQKEDASSPAPSAKVQLGVTEPKKQSALYKRQSSSTSQLTYQSSMARGPSPKRNRVSFQQQPRVILLTPSWTLSNAHSRCLRKCASDGFISMLRMRPSDDNDDEFDSGFRFDTEEGRETFLSMLSSDRTDNRPPAPLSFYAISTERDENFSFGDAIIVPRSFPYYLAVACGLPIVDIEFLGQKANMKRRGTTSHQRYPFPGEDEKKRGGTRHTEKDCLVLGASNYTWDAPKKARAAALERHSLWQKEEGPHAQLETLAPGTDLLFGYSVLLVGDFDTAHHSKRMVAKRKSENKGGGYCTRGNISLLLQLCGAKVYDIDLTSKQIKKGLTENQLATVKNMMRSGASENSPTMDGALVSTMEGDCGNILVMVKDKPDAKLGSEFLRQLNTPLQIPIVTCQWLLDCIGEFEAQDLSKYYCTGTK